MKKPPIVCIIGKSNSGKTTFIEKLIPELKKRGYRVGTIKHSVHGFDIDLEGKDSWRHTQAGADIVVLSSPEALAMVCHTGKEVSLDGIAEEYLKDVDVIIAEGFKKEDKPKIEVYRSSISESPLCSSLELLAIVSDKVTELDVLHFELNDAIGVACLIEEKFLERC
ncbi:MAG: molybdopterin-guanine dinucleotide biosynthesis protein B [Candidatus Subteraquimicrobiales bacterium]|nr:molybdopterin-guanine dinucleotide biosynthesis protein B [Candidatus Subteraquimicrobiales bacterium]